MEDRIVFEDSHLIVIDKPHDMPTQSSEKKKGDDLYNELKRYLAQRENKKVYLALHHRLDAATSGLILFSKDSKINKGVTELFREKKIQKKYVCEVECLKQDQESSPLFQEDYKDGWKVQNKLIEYRFKHFKKAKSSKSGKNAETHFKILSLNYPLARIECSPVTGRMHQIRVHLAELGLPIKGDFHYNPNFKKQKEKSILKLCATELIFTHPLTKETLHLKTQPHF